MPKTLPYHSGDPTPPGYTFQSRPRWGMVIPGGIFFSIGYALAVAVALDPKYNERFWLFVPVVGPSTHVIIEKARCDHRRGSENCSLGDGDTGIELVALFFQAPGAAFLIAGLASPKRRFVRNDLASLDVVPIALPGGAGLGAVGQF